MALIAILSAVTLSASRAYARNVRLGHAAGELMLVAQGLRSAALGDATDYLLVVVDAPDNDATRCSGAVSGCTSYFVVSPQPGWSLADFDRSKPGAHAAVVSAETLPRGARFHAASSYGAPPAPFGEVQVFDGAVAGTCAGNERCFAIRFAGDGSVRAELPRGGSQPTGFAFVLASDAELENNGGDHRGLVIGFPSGIVKAWSYAP